MRRHNEPEQPSSSHHPTKFHTLPRFPSKRPASRDDHSAEEQAASTTSLPSVPETGSSTTPALVFVPAPPITPPNDGIHPESSGASGASVTDVNDRPASPPVQEESSRHRRFSMLRFRNASDSQLAAKARLQAAAEIPPPTPRRMSLLAPTLLLEDENEPLLTCPDCSS
jgi:hypothetical protein